MTSLNTVAAGLPMSFYVQASGVLAGCKLHTYQAGSTTNLATYSDYAGSSANANPITLDTNGAAIIRYLPNTAYKLVLNDPTDVTTLATIDNFYVGAPGGGAVYAGTDTGSANTYTVTVPGTLLAGMRIWFLPAHTNTGASTINGTAIHTVDGNALVGGELQSTGFAEFVYDGTAWQLLTMPYSTGTFTATYTGGTTAPTGTVAWVRQGNIVTVTLPNVTATSNATSFTFTFSQPAGLPVPARTQNISVTFLTDNGTATTGGVQVGNGVYTFYKGAAVGATSWTSSGTKGTNAANTFSYSLV